MTQKEDWNYSTQELLQKFDVTEQGLNNARVEETRRQTGENILQEGKRKSTLEVFLGQFCDLLVVILIIAAILSMFSGNVESTIVILLVLIMNAVVSERYSISRRSVHWRVSNNHLHPMPKLLEMV